VNRLRCIQKYMNDRDGWVCKKTKAEKARSRWCNTSLVTGQGGTVTSQTPDISELDGPRVDG